MTSGGRIGRGAMALAILFAGVAFAAPAARADGQTLAFDRAKGNCLTCHEIKGGPAPGNLGPPLADMKVRFPDRKELIAIVADETKRNPLTVMPPFKRNLILTDKEIEEIVDFLQTL
jgi:L-cysteine S-thiosulfotransferase